VSSPWPTLYREKLAITGTAGQVLVLYHPAGPGSAGKLTLLASYALPVRDGEPQPGSTART
jgi:hypothetical protein